MYILFAMAGLVTLIAIMWCLRMMRRGQTTLQKERERFQEHFREEETRLNKEQQEIPAQEQTHLLRVAIEDLIRLENCTDTECVLEGNSIRIVRNSDTFLTITLSTREQKLTSLHKVLHSPAIWSLTNGDETRTYTSLDTLMKALVAIFRGEEPDDPESLDKFRKRRT